MGNKEIPTELAFLVLNSVDPDWASAEAQKMIDFHPPSELSNSSGKFYRTYECWHFHKSSSWPLIQKFCQILEESRNHFFSRMGKELGVEFVILTRVRALGSEICNFHRDGYFFDGQMHLTITGMAGIELLENDLLTPLTFPNGQVWYLNGSRYLHRVRPVEEVRLELCAPINQRVEDVKVKMSAVSKDPHRWVNGNDPTWISLRKRQIDHVRRAVAKGTASNLQIAEFSLSEKEEP